MFHYCPPKVLPDLFSETLPSGRFYTLPDGSRLPSVTTVLGVRKKASIQQWRDKVGSVEANKITKKASGRGTGMHTLCEKYLRNEKNIYNGSMPDGKEMFLQIKPFVDRIDNIHFQEQALYSKGIWMAGRVDVIAEFDGVLSVIDFKTSSKTKKREYVLDYFAQCTAYSMMYEELTGVPINQLVIIMGVTNEKPQLFVEKVEDHTDYLLESIRIYKESLNK